MPIAIIGSRGYIGSYLLQYFGDAAVGDPHLSDLNKYSTVIYLGGYSSRQKCNTWTDVYRHNVQDVASLADSLTDDQLLIFASTGAIASFAENYTEDAMIKPENMDFYTRSMYEREQVLKTKSVKTIGLRLGGVVGSSPHMRWDLSYHSMLKSARETGVINVCNPDSYRSMLWIRDLACCIECLLNFNVTERHSIYNLASFDVCIMDIAKDIAAATKASIQITPGPVVPSFRLDTSKYCREFATFTFRGSRKMVEQDLKFNY